MPTLYLQGGSFIVLNYYRMNGHPAAGAGPAPAPINFSQRCEFIPVPLEKNAHNTRTFEPNEIVCIRPGSMQQLIWGVDKARYVRPVVIPSNEGKVRDHLLNVRRPDGTRFQRITGFASVGRYPTLASETAFRSLARRKNMSENIENYEILPFLKQDPRRSTRKSLRKNKKVRKQSRKQRR